MKTRNQAAQDHDGVQMVRRALEQATGKVSVQGDDLPLKLIVAGQARGATADDLARWIVDFAVTKRRRGDPIRSHGFFQRVIEQELPAWLWHRPLHVAASPISGTNRAEQDKLETLQRILQHPEIHAEEDVALAREILKEPRHEKETPARGPGSTTHSQAPSSYPAQPQSIPLSRFG